MCLLGALLMDQDEHRTTGHHYLAMGRLLAVAASAPTHHGGNDAGRLTQTRDQPTVNANFQQTLDMTLLPWGHCEDVNSDRAL